MKKVKLPAIAVIFCLLLTLIPPALAEQNTGGSLGNTTYLVGESARTLSVGSVDKDTDYQWQSAEDTTFLLYLDIKGATGTLYTPSTTESGTYYYRCKMTNGSAVTFSNKAKITVLEKPTLTLTPASQAVAFGTEADLAAKTLDTDGWELIKSYWAWGPTADASGVTGDFSTAGVFADTSLSQTITRVGSIYYFYVGQYRDIANGTKTVTVYSNAAKITTAVDNPFTDIRPSDWFYGDVLSAYAMGLISGMTETTYNPVGHLTIAQAIRIAACMHQYNEAGAVTLTNSTGRWYDSYVDYAVSNGIITKSAYSGHYNDAATRADYVKIFYYALPAVEFTPIHDVPDGSIPGVSLDDPSGYEIYAFYRAGILRGYDNSGTFSPGNTIKRSEVAAIISRMMDNTSRLTTPYPWLETENT